MPISKAANIAPTTIMSSVNPPNTITSVAVRVVTVDNKDVV